jgi:hypothetical protein
MNEIPFSHLLNGGFQELPMLFKRRQVVRFFFSCAQLGHR